MRRMTMTIALLGTLACAPSEPGKQPLEQGTASIQLDASHRRDAAQPIPDAAIDDAGEDLDAALPDDAGELPDAGDIPDAATATTVDYERDIQPIWDSQCLACHANDSNGLNLSAGVSKEQLLTGTVFCINATGDGVDEKPTVVPGDPMASILIHKLGNVNMDCNREMPPYGLGGLIAMDEPSFRLVETWILEGAQ